ncbi:hypothetical protein TNIN_3741 [Trichonephila inaurata madagascariensis]|uniref:Uncharacterized protein n=1 Tax=Trichonephila inaurata madagascariensis TaxID=2747483 RepID=A0A8X6WSQ9_9ARAC|nr:hypothetical protein TNIN_3741 [Trichonephila inaurata madagascariensis]
MPYFFKLFLLVTIYNNYNRFYHICAFDPSFKFYQVAPASNLDKLERVQLSAASVITGSTIATRGGILYEADLQPLMLQSRYLWPNTLPSSPVSLNSTEHLVIYIIGATMVA